MALATRCPACETVFRISTAQAAAKGGMVRCGQCRNVFNSLDALVRVEDLEVIDEVDVRPMPPAPPLAAVPPATAPAPHAVPAAVVPAIEAPEDVAGSIGGSASVAVPPHAPDPVADPETLFVPASEPKSAPSPAPAPVAVPVDDRAVIQEWWVPDPDATVAPLIGNTAVIEHTTLDGGRDDAGQLLSGRRGDLPTTGSSLIALDAAFMRPAVAPAEHSRLARRILAVLCGAAVATLAAQAVYLWRDEIAVRWPPSRGWLAAACRPVRCTIDYPMHIDALTIESAGVQTAGAPNVYLLTALLRNRDTVDVRYPYLELVLTDLQDRPILRRDLRPEDYLGAGRLDGRTPRGGFGAQSELPIRLTFELSDLRFAGYRLEKFYP